MIGEAILQAIATGLLSGLVSGGAILIAVRQDVKWLKLAIHRLERNVTEAHRRIDKL